MHTTPPITWDLQHLDEVDSTNRLAAEQILDRWKTAQPAEGIALLARRQTRGRGQHGRRWESPAGGLYLSAVLENIPSQLRERMALVAGVAVLQALAGNFQIRWPNDVVNTHGKKLAGILCEAIAQGDRWAVIVGVGVNVSTRLDRLPEELHHAATSLAAENSAISVDHLAAAILLHLAECSRLPLPAIVAKVRAADFLRGKKIRVEDSGKTFSGTAAGLTESGALKLEIPSASPQIFDRGTIRIDS